MALDVEALFDAQQLQRSRAYARQQRRWLLASWILSPLYLSLWMHPHLQQWLNAQATPLSSWRWIQVAYSFILIGLGYWILHTFLAIPREILNQRYGLSRANWELWFTDRVKGGLLVGVLGAIALSLTSYLMVKDRTLWWLWTATGAIAVMFLLQFIAPIVLASLFYHFEPLQDEALRRRFLNLARQVGIDDIKIYRFDMSRRTWAANAAVLGMGKTRRIVVSDTLLNKFSPEEAEAVLAHELGHQVHKDHFLGFLLQSILTLLAFYTLDVVLNAFQPTRLAPTSPPNVPLMLLTIVLFGMIATPFLNMWLRARETLADLFAVTVTQNPSLYARVLARLSMENLLDPWPPQWYVWLFGTHPPMGERIRMVLDIMENKHG